MSNDHRLNIYRVGVKAGFKLFFVIFVVLLLTAQDSHAERKKKLLVLHSYHQGLEWTDNITKGIQSIFSSHMDEYEVYYEYLDTKRNTGKEYIDKMVRFLLTKNAHNRYEAIIVSDNNALSLINDGRINFPGNPPLVFCGINNFNHDLIKNLKDVTGVIEKTDHQATIDLMRKLHPERDKIIVIIDRTPTGDAIREEFRTIESRYKSDLQFVFMRDFLLSEIPGKLSSLDDQSLIYITTFNRDRNNNFISYSEGIELITSNTNVPIYGSWDFYLGKGIVGGRITSGYLQGQAAAKLALKILHGDDAGDLPIVENSPTRYMFDYKYLQQYGINSASLPSDSLVINSPPAAYQRYRTLLIAITILSISATLGLLWKVKRQRSILVAKQALAENLEQKVSKRTHQLEKAYKELQRLSNLDGLTQIYNRRFFDNILESEIKRLQRTTTPISLLLCDIDFFKKYNDTYGHLAGDDCIRAVADSIQQHCKRISDIAARYGGEEYAVILPNTGATEASSIAESIRRSVELRNIAHETSSTAKVVTLSIGIASLTPDRSTTPSTLISLADKALYKSKHGGRNRVTLMTAGNPPSHSAYPE